MRSGYQLAPQRAGSEISANIRYSLNVAQRCDVPGGGSRGARGARRGCRIRSERREPRRSAVRRHDDSFRWRWPDRPRRSCPAPPARRSAPLGNAARRAGRRLVPGGGRRDRTAAGGVGEGAPDPPVLARAEAARLVPQADGAVARRQRVSDRWSRILAGRPRRPGVHDRHRPAHDRYVREAVLVDLRLPDRPRRHIAGQVDRSRGSRVPAAHLAVRRRVCDAEEARGEVRSRQLQHRGHRRVRDLGRPGDQERSCSQTMGGSRGGPGWCGAATSDGSR